MVIMFCPAWMYKLKSNRIWQKKRWVNLRSTYKPHRKSSPWVTLGALFHQLQVYVVYIFHFVHSWKNFGHLWYLIVGDVCYPHFQRGGGGSQCVPTRVLSTLSCREYFDAKQISTVSFLTVVFGAKVLKILHICAFSPPKCCMLFILEIKSLPKGGSRAPQDPPCYALGYPDTLHKIILSTLYGFVLSETFLPS